MCPVVVIDKALGERMASTIRHNRARGTHNVELMSQIVAELGEMGKGDRWICQNIGMSADELLRLKQITGIAALFANRDFSQSWDVDLEDEESVDTSGFDDALCGERGSERIPDDEPLDESRPAQQQEDTDTSPTEAKQLPLI